MSDVESMRLFVLVGLPGSGKTTWLERNGKPSLSSDALRAQLTGDDGNQSLNSLVFANLRRMVRERLEDGCAETWIDSTALTPRERRVWIRQAKPYGCPVEAVLFDTPLEVCRARNEARERKVPAAAMERMAKRIVPPRVEEGFDQGTVGKAG